MQVQFNKTAIRCLGTALQQVQNSEVTQELRLSDGMPDIGRVLATWGQVIIRSKQWQGDTIQLTGGVMTWTLYAPEDGTEPRSVEGWIPFQLTWQLDDSEREGPMRMMPLLRFADSRSISARKLMLRAGVSALVQAMHPINTEIYTPSEVPEDVQLQKMTYPLMVPVECGEKTFAVDEELVLPELGMPLDKLLGLMVNPEITEKRIMSDKVVFKGSLGIHGVCRQSDGQVISFDQSVPFSQLEELDRAYGGDTLTDIQMAVTSLEADMNEPGKIRMKCGLVAQYLVDERHLLELVADAYSPQRDVDMEKEDLEIPVILDERTEYIQAEQTVPGQNGRVADSIFLPDFPRKRRSENGVDMELTGVFQSLIYDDDGTLQGANARWEGSAQLCSDGKCDPLITVRPSGKVQSMTSMDALTLSSQMQMWIQTGMMAELPMVTALELGPIREADPSRPSVILTAAAGESLWDLAKRSGSTVSAIQMANKLNDDTAPDQMLLIPVL